MKYVFIASPYTTGDVASNVRDNLLAAETVARAGFVPFAPLLYHLWHLVSPQNYEFWTALDLAWLDKCDALIRLPGASTGADNEIIYARRIGIPVFAGMQEFLETIDCERCMSFDEVHSYKCPNHPDHDPTRD